MRAIETTVGNSWAESRSVTLRCQAGRNSGARNFSSVGRNAPAGLCEWIALNGLKSSIFLTTARNKEPVGWPAASVLSRSVFHDHLGVLAGRLEKGLDALRSAAIGAALLLAIAVFIHGAFAIAAIHRDGYQVRALTALNGRTVLDRAAHSIRSIIRVVARITF